MTGVQAATKSQGQLCVCNNVIHKYGSDEDRSVDALKVFIGRDL